MKIYDFSPFNNENIICEIKSFENKKWMDQTHIFEFDRTFQNVEKLYNFNLHVDNKLIYHKIPASKLFVDDTLKAKVKRKLKSLSGTGIIEFGDGYVVGNAWLNEAIQRNYSQKIIENIRIDDDDILIFSDVDEIIDSDNREEIIKEVYKHGIITIKLSLTTYYFNLKLKNIGGPEDYSYRVFIMTGKRYKSLNVTIDMIRKAGERGRLVGLVYCPDKILGVHHSSLGDIDFIFNKLKSFSHIELKKYTNKENIEELIKNNESYLEGSSTFVDNKMKQLSSVVENMPRYKKFFI